MDHHIPIHSSKWLTKSLPHILNIFSGWIIQVVILIYGYRVNSYNGCTVKSLAKSSGFWLQKGIDRLEDHEF